MASGDLLHGSIMPKTDCYGKGMLRPSSNSGLKMASYDDDDEWSDQIFIYDDERIKLGWQSLKTSLDLEQTQTNVPLPEVVGSFEVASSCKSYQQPIIFDYSLY